MPWKECNAMDERLRFVAKLLDGEKMAVMCREFGISRKTGYKLIKEYPVIRPPAASTIHAILDRHGLVKRRKRKRYKAQGTDLSHAQAPNGLWCADYKGQFMLGNHKYCYPLTITDYRSRYLFACEGLESVKETGAFSVFEQVFKDFGLPAAIRTDNGVPFASPHALFGLS